MSEIKTMTNEELAAAIRVLNYQVCAKLFVGDRQNRIEVLNMLETEKKARGF